MGKCRTCKYWWKGEKIHYSESSVEWNGNHHPKAGTVEVKRGWKQGPTFEYDRITGQCMASNNFLYSLITTKNDDKTFLTREHFGCDNWKSDGGRDKYSHTYVDSRGQQSLNDYIKEMKLQPEFDEPIGIKWNSKGVGWLFYKDPEPTKCEGETMPTVVATVEVKE